MKFSKGKVFRSTSKHRQTDILLFERLFLKYHTEFPLSVVLCTEAEEKYNKIFQWLIKIKRANCGLQNFKEWRLLFKEFPSLSCNKLIHQFQIFEREVGHFVRTLESFVYTRAIVPNAAKTVKDMLESKDFDSLVSNHLKSLQKIIDTSLCDVKFF